MPKVSICIPTYNNVEEVAKLLQSIEEQDYLDYEILINDDSDNRDIEELVQKLKTGVEHCYAQKIDYIHNKEKLGHIFNWNAPIKRAKGEYIKIMFSDDWFTYPTSLSEYVALLEEHTDADFAFSNSMQVSDTESYERSISEQFIPRLQQDYRNLFMGNEVGAPSGMIYRNKGILFDEESNWASDLVLYFRILHQNPGFAYTMKPLISIGLHGEQYTHMFSEKDDRIFGDYYMLYQKYHLEENELCKEFFLREYIMKFDKSLKVAKTCGVPAKEYVRTRMAYLWQNKVVDYWNQGLRKIGLKRKDEKNN